MDTQKLAATLKDVGGVAVARVLPQKALRTIGAWCFLDHAGPVEFDANSKGMQIGSHPHTNMQTFTWMLRGEMWHQDSLGYRQLVQAQQVGLMTAGTGNKRGISHTEQTPAGVQALHALQLWIALPLEQEIDASFVHYSELPHWSEHGVDYVLTTGSYHGHTAPTLQYSPLLGVDIRCRQGGEVTLTLETGFEYGVLIVAGSIDFNGERYVENDLMHLSNIDSADTAEITIAADTHKMLLGGEPLSYQPMLWWNFVAGNHEDLAQAVADWNAGDARFGDIDLSGTTLTRLTAPEMLSKPKFNRLPESN